MAVTCRGMRQSIGAFFIGSLLAVFFSFLASCLMSPGTCRGCLGPRRAPPWSLSLVAAVNIDQIPIFSSHAKRVSPQFEIFVQVFDRSHLT